MKLKNPETLNKLTARLLAETTAEICFDDLSCQIWASDASIFRIKPLGITLPRTLHDLQKIVEIATDLSIPLIPRGAATGISGGCLGRGLVIDVSKYLNKILEINFEEEYVVVEPGVILDDLNEKLSVKGYRIGPETSTGNRATLGGMAANNSSGARSLRYGKMVDHVQEATVIISGGSKVLLRKMKEGEWEKRIQEESPLGKIVRAAETIREQYAAEINGHFPKIDRRVSGYNLDKLLTPDPPNLAEIIVGSEGSLGIISSLKIKICKKPLVTGLVLIHLHHLPDCFQALHSMLHWEPLALELIDRHILMLSKNVPRISESLHWLIGDPEAVVIAELEARTTQELKLKLSSFEADMRHHRIGYAYSLISKPEEVKAVWEVRKAGLGLLMSKRSYSNAIAFLEDMAIPTEKLPIFMEKFLKLLKDLDLEAGIYGHIGAGCMHIRPYLNLLKETDLQLLAPMMKEVASLILENKGALSGEHGDGLIRSWLNETMFGPRIMKAFLLLKQAFDPQNLMNPGKVVNGVPLDDLRSDLKISPDTFTPRIPTYLNFEKEGGFSLAVDLCNGNGLCRKKSGVMCPSFQATHDEFDTTRARANSLQEMIHKNPSTVNWNDKGVEKVLDLCLECKGCKTECPSSVDMAKMKSEFLYHYQKANGLPFRSFLLSSFPTFFRFGTYFSKLLNALSEKLLFKNVLKLVGIAPERSLPQLADERFSTWYNKNIKGKQDKGKRVVLFNDTYNEYCTPEIGKSAVQILNLLGYEVICPPWHCCGRPYISKGRLEEARYQAVKLVQTLSVWAKAKVPIIGLEPSCILTLVDEYQNFPNLDARAVGEMAITFDEFIAEQLVEGKLPLPFKNTPVHVKLHGHCHQKALVGMEPTLAVLKGVPGFQVEEIPSGCCGMAGSFGYEKEHYKISMDIGELVLLPAVREATKETLIVANGMSCRTQIADGAGRSAIHLAEALTRHLK